MRLGWDFAGLRAGVVASCLAFAWKSAQRVTATRITMDYAYDGRPAGVYMLSGPLFFASTAVFKCAPT